jgi:type IV pilus assembly protein PilF
MTLLLISMIAACAARAPAAGSSGDSKDIVTASDETDASKRARVRMELATGYFGRGQMTTALDQVKLALVADPALGEAYNLRGLIYANLGDDRLAEESFRRALQLNVRDTDTMQNFGYFLCQKKRYAEANTMFDQALAVPQYVEPSRTLLTKGVCQAFAGQLAESEATLLRAYELDPANPSTAVNLSEVLYRRAEYERARFYIRRVNAIPAMTGSQTLWLAARIEQRLGNRVGAQEFGELLRKRFPESREAASFARGNFDE